MTRFYDGGVTSKFCLGFWVYVEGLGPWSRDLGLEFSFWVSKGGATTKLFLGLMA
jgi:hypothetical protein